MEANKFQVKFFLKNNSVELEKLIPVFHTWIRENRIDDELLIDVADYAHVQQGPGVVLIGHESDYYVDVADDRPGLLYSRKRGIDGDLEARVRDAFSRALRACQLLEQEADLGFEFSSGEVVFRVQDRLHAPNTDETLRALRPALEATTQALFLAEATLERIGTQREPFSVVIQTGSTDPVDSLVNRI